jgi:uncharacterized membrane protein
MILKIIPWVLLAGLWGLAAWAWGVMPDSMPVHWNMAGEVDRVGSKLEGVLLLPAVATGLLALFQVIPRLDPGQANYAQMQGPWALMQISLLLVFGILYGAGLGLYSMEGVLPFALGGMFMLIGAIMGKVRPNYLFGIRTPWTLSSKLSWTKTHRLGGFGFLSVGILVLIAGFISAKASFITMMASLLLLVGGLFWYSYSVWKSDSERIPPGGTSPV